MKDLAMPLVLAVSAAILGALVAAQCAGDQARAAEAAVWQARFAVQAESTTAWRGRTAEARAQLIRLRADSGKVYAALAVAREAAAVGLATIRTLAHDTAARHAPNAGAVLADAAAAIAIESHACTNALTNCEARAQKERARADDATSQLNTLTQLQDSTARRLKKIERAASPGFLGVRDVWRAKGAIGVLLFLLLVTHR